MRGLSCRYLPILKGSPKMHVLKGWDPRECWGEEKKVFSDRGYGVGEVTPFAVWKDFTTKCEPIPKNHVQLKKNAAPRQGGRPKNTNGKVGKFSSKKM